MRKKWFKAKQYGFGWTPVTWQGWLVVILYILIVLKILMRVGARSQSVIEMLFNFVPEVVLLTIFLVIICYLTGEKPSWNWGKKKSSEESVNKV